MVTAASATTVLAICLGILAFSATGAMRGASDVYYFDMATGRLFTAPGGQLLPIATSSSDATVIADHSTGGVLAYVFACNSCSDSNDRFIGYLQTHNPRTLERFSKGGHGGAETSLAIKLLYLQESEDGLLVRAFNTDTNQGEGDWVPERSSRASAVFQTVTRRCGEGASPMRCEP